MTTDTNMKKIQIHKNDLADTFLVGGRKGLKKVKIGNEKYIRWIDIPEYVVVEQEFSEDTLQDIKMILAEMVDVMYLNGHFISEKNAKAILKSIDNL